MTRWRSRSTRRASSGGQVHLDPSGAADPAQRVLVGRARTSWRGSRTGPSWRGTRASTASTQRRRRRMPPTPAVAGAPATPVRIQTAASASPRRSARARSARASSRTSPCWNDGDHHRRRVAAASRSHKPPCTAAAKLTTQVPTVKPSVRIAAVAGCSVSAMRRGGQRDREGRRSGRWPRPRPAASSGAVDRPAVAHPERPARRAPGSEASAHAAASTARLWLPRAPSGTAGRCSSSLERARLAVAGRPRGWPRTAAGTPPPARTR